MHRTAKRTARNTAAALALLGAAPAALAQEGGDQTQTAFEMFFLSSNMLGLVVTWLLIVLSMCVMALIIKFLMDNKASAIIPPESVNTYDQMLQDKRYREAIDQASEDDSVFGQLVHASLSEAANGYGAMERAIEEEADLAGSKRARQVEVLGVIGSVGPMIGLFGTVYGMIVAFQTIVNKGGSPDPAELAGGISTALVTTFWGLVVGIPATAASALIRNKIDGLVVEAMVQAESLIAPFSPAARKKKGSSGSSGEKAESGGSGGGGERAKPQPKPSG